jgi:PKD repeat protein
MKNKKRNLILIGRIVFFCAIILPALGLATTYYVATNGKDSYNGLFPSYQSGSNGPFRTLNRASARVAAGDTVKIRGGTYKEAVTVNASGTSSNRIRITNYSGESPIIDGAYSLPGGNVYYYLVSITGNYVTFSNISIIRSAGAGLVLAGHYDYAISVSVNGAREVGICGGSSTSSHNKVDGCTATDTGNGYGINGQRSWGAGIVVQGDSNTIQNCISYENRGEGLNTCKNSTNAIIQDSISYNNKSYNLYIDSATSATVRRNMVYQTKSQYLMNGIIIGAETGQPSNLLVYNNLVMGCRVNFEIDSNVTRLSNVTVAYNTFVNSIGGIIGYTMGVYYRPNINTYTNSIFTNNIVIEEYADRVPISVESSHPGLTFSCNCWNKTPAAAAAGTGDVIGDPLLAKTGPKGPGLLTPAYFKILANSPARDQARVLSQVKEDFFRTPRRSAPDMGGHEFSSGISPLTASATGSPTSGQTPLGVNLTGSATGGTSPYSYRWTFGDGGSSTSQNPSHTYSSAGSYTATLTVTDSQSATNSKSLTITVTSAHAQLVATASASPTSGQAPLTVNFTGSATGSAPRCSYSWNFGDGGTSSTQNPSYTYSAVGTYTATLTVTDSVSTNATAAVNINATKMTSANLSLAAQTGAPAHGQGGTTDPAPGTYSFSIGSTVQAKSIPNPDYRFSKWEGDVSQASTFDSEISITMDNNKSLSSTFCTKCTDVNGDLRTTPADAQLAFDIYLNRISNPTWCELENADVSASGTKQSPKVTPSDAQTIFNKYLKKGDVNINCSRNSRSSVASMQNLAQPAVQLTIGNSPFNQGKDIYIPIIVESPSEIGAFGFDLLFPSNQLTYIGLERTELTADFDQLDATVIPYLMSPGDSIPAQASGLLREPSDGFDQQPANMVNTSVVRVGGYKTTPAANPSYGVLITLIFRASGELKDSSSILIIATYDDIQNASIIDGTLMPKTSRAERPARPSAPKKRLSGKRYDF